MLDSQLEARRADAEQLLAIARSRHAAETRILAEKFAAKKLSADDAPTLERIVSGIDDLIVIGKERKLSDVAARLETQLAAARADLPKLEREVNETSAKYVDAVFEERESAIDRAWSTLEFARQRVAQLTEQCQAQRRAAAQIRNSRPDLF